MLQVADLQVRINSQDGVIRAVNGVSFAIEMGETVAIVGESGSGKSVLAQSLMRLHSETNVFYPKGKITFEGKDLLELKEREVRKIRGHGIAMIFQDPMSSLNPVFQVGYQLIEAIRAHQKISSKKAKEKAIELLTDVGISDPKRRMKEYPHQFSGGMRQRILITIALASQPKLLIADEPTTALDVTIQAQIIQLLKGIQEKYKMGIIIITHDLGVVANIADRVLVMYAGRIVESGSVEGVFYHTRMPYTWSLLQALPRIDQASDHRLYNIKGRPPKLTESVKGCHFYSRCPFATGKCKEETPALKEVGEGHKAACILTESEFIRYTQGDQTWKDNEVKF